MGWADRLARALEEERRHPAESAYSPPPDAEPASWPADERPSASIPAGSGEAPASPSPEAIPPKDVAEGRQGAVARVPAKSASSGELLGSTRGAPIPSGPFAAELARLVSAPVPPSVPPARWAGFVADASRLHADGCAELLAAGWDALDLFGLHRVAPAVRLDAAGLAWMLRGRVLRAVRPDTAELVTASGAVQRAKRLGPSARAEAVLAWSLPGL